MVKQLLTSKAFTYIEMILVLGIVSLLLLLQVRHISINNSSLQSNNHSMTNLIMQFNYLKSKAIKDNKPITLIFNTFSSKIIVREPQHENFPIKLTKNTYIHPKTNINYLTFDKNGDTNKFGTLYLSRNNRLYKIIFHIEKGTIRFEKI
ncbi:competence type IV pilus minor pilin ComGD [Staphylococcus sp. NAM3COL9]|uniref:competence type IV pilus minor pilin ComGD n=1 Tax=Staphylococcus sp. NAM3COL9 TaxID=1667172 RepID=UPI00070A6853|nr:competence type IV pilus minor pilin ComGD [Staphylococcus sp. NAM3COL9]KRG10267.1 competence protein [Staphylococcus sp. NAM3COL9]